VVIGDFWNDITGIVTVSLIFGGWIVVVVVGSIAKNWRKVHESEHAAVLKQSMIERGMSADEIERVLRAGPVPAPTGAESEPSVDQSSELAGILAEHGVDASSLGTILSEYRAAHPSSRKALVETITVMLDNGARGDQILAAVRALGQPDPHHASAPRFSDSPASFRN
jgi:hypothetical protein